MSDGRLSIKRKATRYVAKVTTAPAFAVPSRAPLYEGVAPSLDLSRGLDVSSDGKELVGIRPTDRQMRVSVVLNVGQELRERAKR